MATPRNVPAPNIGYFIPKLSQPPGAALSSSPPVLFQPLQIRDVIFQNRIWVTPMCTYSGDNGHATDFHLIHLGSFILRGASLTILEATAVQPEGRISPEDLGIWQDSHIAPIRRIADFAHSQGQKLGIQLGHAGRKASTVAPWLVPVRGTNIVATEDVGGWPKAVKGPSAICWGRGHSSPAEYTVDEIKQLIIDYREAAIRSIAAGVDVIEIHAAHGYLLCSFLSPLSNTRTDEYGGNAVNRARIIFEITAAIRAVIPSGTPLLLRVSATEWMEQMSSQPSWDLPATISLARQLHSAGIDLIDVSSGGNNIQQQIPAARDFQVELAGKIRAALKAEGNSLLVGTVGLITEAEQARDIVAGGVDAKADVILIGRQFLREPEWVFRVASRLGVKITGPIQYERGQFLPNSLK